MQYRTSTIDHATEIYLGPDSEGLEALIDRGDTTYIVNIPAPSRCGWCHEPIVSVHFPIRGWLNADVFTDEGGFLRADVLHEHRCEPMERYAERLAVRDDPWEGDAQ